MEITRILNSGQVIIPEELRKSHGWETGQELIVIDTGEGILLKPKKTFAQTTLNKVAGCLKYQGTAKSLQGMVSDRHHFLSFGFPYRKQE